MMIYVIKVLKTLFIQFDTWSTTFMFTSGFSCLSTSLNVNDPALGQCIDMVMLLMHIGGWVWLNVESDSPLHIMRVLLLVPAQSFLRRCFQNELLYKQSFNISWLNMVLNYEMKTHRRRSGRLVGRKGGRQGEVHEKNSFATQASLTTCRVATVCICVGVWKCVREVNC